MYTCIITNNIRYIHVVNSPLAIPVYGGSQPCATAICHLRAALHQTEEAIVVHIMGSVYIVSTVFIVRIVWTLHRNLDLVTRVPNVVRLDIFSSFLKIGIHFERIENCPRYMRMLPLAWHTDRASKGAIHTDMHACTRTCCIHVYTHIYKTYIYKCICRVSICVHVYATAWEIHTSPQNTNNLTFRWPVLYTLC